MNLMHECVLHISLNPKTAAGGQGMTMILEK
jgi:hypothetical protein